MNIDETIVDLKKNIVNLIKSLNYSILPLILIVLISVGIYNQIFDVLFPNVSQDSDVYILAISIVFEIILYLIVSVSYLYLFKKVYEYEYIHNGIFNFNRILNRKDIYLVIIGTISLVVLNYILEYIIIYIGIEKSENAIINIGQASDPIFFLYMIPIMFLVVGFGEEILFRGILQGGFRKYLSVRSSIIITSLIFALFHMPALDSSISQKIPYIITTFLLAILLGYIYENSENILVAILIHGSYNSVLMALQYLSEVSVI